MDGLRVTAAFADEASCVCGIEALQALGLARPCVFSPFASESIAHALKAPRLNPSSMTRRKTSSFRLASMSFLLCPIRGRWTRDNFDVVQ